MKDTSPSSASVRLNGISHRFGRRQVLSDVNGEIESGGVLMITGANGSGKSTLLRIIAGLLIPTNGRAELQVDDTSLSAIDRRPHLGYVAPDLALYRELSGAENLVLFARLRGIELPRERLVDLLEKVGLKGRGRDFVADYSSGMRQRLKYAFALLHSPPVLLLDEPTANLDAQGAALARAIVNEQRQSGLAIIATNEQTEVQWGDRVVALSSN